ncbi:MAG: hypothetical protein AAGJ18_12720, partial [Bacteroidota bacterium]
FLFVGGVSITFLNLNDGIEYVSVRFSFSGTLTAAGNNLNGRLGFTAIHTPANDRLLSTRCDYTLSPS